jgi:hypothetical protein
MIWMIALLAVALWLLARHAVWSWVRGVEQDPWILNSWVWFVVVLFLYPDIMVQTINDYLKGRA